jgi:hypothetical protein
MTNRGHTPNSNRRSESEYSRETDIKDPESWLLAEGIPLGFFPEFCPRKLGAKGGGALTGGRRDDGINQLGKERGGDNDVNGELLG